MNLHSVAQLLIAVSIGCLGACTWVELTPAGESVIAMTAAPESCKRLGQTSSMTKNDIATIDRNREKVATELETLARNAAAKMGGDAIVPESEISETGEQTFGIYRCGR